ncbi:Fc receptor-like protein 5 [Pholidichthys leucotaenia]
MTSHRSKKPDTQLNMLSTCSMYMTPPDTHTYTSAHTHIAAKKYAKQFRETAIPNIYHTAMRNHRNHLLLPLLALVSFLVKINKCGSSPLQTVLTGPDVVYNGSRVIFQCLAPDISPPIVYYLIKDSGVLIAREVKHQGGQPSSFRLKATATSDGSYHCKAKAGNKTAMSNTIKLSVVTPPSNTKVISEPFPPVVHEGSRIILRCETQSGSHLSYTWFFNRKEITPSRSSLFHPTENKLVMERVTPQHAGSYYCMAWSTVYDIRRFSTSAEVKVIVKVHLSKPKISFYVSKDGTSYHANLTCWSSRGSPPVNFSLLLDDKEVESVTVAESLAAWFHVAIVPGLDMGTASCRAKTDLQELMSEPVFLEVVPVGGDVKVEVEYLYTAASDLAAVMLSCHVSRGTFPYFSWLWNDSATLPHLYMESSIQRRLPHLALTNQRWILIHTKLSPEESGYYRCRVRDSYDDSGPWVESAAELVQVTGEKIRTREICMNIMEGIAIAFCCFLLLVLVMGSAFVYMMSDSRQGHTYSAPANSKSTSLLEGKLPDTPTTDVIVQNQTIESML